jgi:hypothetical protein
VITSTDNYYIVERSMLETSKTNSTGWRAVVRWPGFEDKLVTTLGGESLEKV